MATLLVKLKIKPGMEARYEQIQSDLYQQTHDIEKGVVRRYEAWRGTEERTYYAILSYDDYYTFMRDHQTSSHHELATPPLMEVIEAESIEWVDPLPRASDLPPTTDQELPEEASPLVRRYHEAMGFSVPGWWANVR